MGMALTCCDFIESLIDYCSGDLDADEHARCEAHLLECSDCLEYFRSYEETIRLSKSAFNHPEGAAAADIPEELVRAILLRARASRLCH